jgi:hypothetical protein
VKGLAKDAKAKVRLKLMLTYNLFQVNAIFTTSTLIYSFAILHQ